MTRGRKNRIRKARLKRAAVEARARHLRELEERARRRRIEIPTIAAFFAGEEDQLVPYRGDKDVRRYFAPIDWSSIRLGDPASSYVGSYQTRTADLATYCLDTDHETIRLRAYVEPGQEDRAQRWANEKLYEKAGRFA